MEKLDKEALAKNYANNDEDTLSQYDYKAGLEYAENHYLTLIEDKNKDISRIQARRTEITEEASRLKSELLQAKELLKNILKTSVLTKYEINEIEEFLKK